jgi:hypothetical protein
MVVSRCEHQDDRGRIVAPFRSRPISTLNHSASAELVRAKSASMCGMSRIEGAENDVWACSSSVTFFGGP